MQCSRYIKTQIKYVRAFLIKLHYADTNFVVRFCFHSNLKVNKLINKELNFLKFTPFVVQNIGII